MSQMGDGTYDLMSCWISSMDNEATIADVPAMAMDRRWIESDLFPLSCCQEYLELLEARGVPDGAAHTEDPFGRGRGQSCEGRAHRGARPMTLGNFA